MIIPLRFYKEHGVLKALGIVAKGVGSQLAGLFGFRSEINALLEREAAPRLKRNEKGETFCVSCGLCARLCPSKSISIEVDKSIVFPESLKSGPAPKLFQIHNESCLRCSLCVSVCPVDALTPTKL